MKTLDTDFTYSSNLMNSKPNCSEFMIKLNFRTKAFSTPYGYLSDIEILLSEDEDQSYDFLHDSSEDIDRNFEDIKSDLEYDQANLGELITEYLCLK